MAEGYDQYGALIIDSFFLVVKPETIRLVFSFAFVKDWPISELDVHNAFLNRELDEIVYTK